MRIGLIERFRTRLTAGTVAALAAAAGVALAAPAAGQQDGDGWEWEPGKGYHEEEWYDPGDWFDDEFSSGVDYEETGRDWGWDWDWGWDDDDDYYDDDDYDDDYYDDYYGDDDFFGYGDRDRDPDHWDRRRDDAAMDRERYDRRFNNQQRRDRADTMRGDRQDARQGMGSAQVRGEIEAWQRKRLEGQRDAHTLVRMRVEDGRSAIVNLGPNVDVRRLDLDEEDRVMVRGMRGRIDGRPVLMAQSVQVGDKVVRMNNWDQRASGQQSQDWNREGSRQEDRQGSRMAQLRGEIEAWNRTYLEGQRDAHTLVRMRVEDGRSAIVNLGPNVDLRRLDIEEDDEIAVEGVRGRIDDWPVLMAQRVKIGDRTIRVNNGSSRSDQRDRDRDRDD